MQLTLLQFNAWLLKLPFFRAKDFKERKKHLPDYLAAENADVISLMEIWVQRDKEYMVSEMRERGYPYSFYTPHRFGLGDGLLFLSRYPIIESLTSKPYVHFTRFTEYFAAKRIAKIVVELPSGETAAFFQTHLGAVTFQESSMLFSKKGSDKLATQIEELIAFIRDHSPEKYVFLAGDLNFHYHEHLHSKEYEKKYSKEYLALIRPFGDGMMGFQNSFLEGKALKEIDPFVPTYSQNNPYVARSESQHYPDGTLDYIFHRPVDGLKAVDASVIFDTHAPPENRILSDHYGLKCVFHLPEELPGRF